MISEEQNGWNENRKLILSSIDRINSNIDEIEKCTNRRVKDVEKELYDFKEKTGIELARLKTKSSILTSIISVVVSLVVSVSAALIANSILINSDRHSYNVEDQNNINSIEEFQKFLENKIEKKFNKE